MTAPELIDQQGDYTYWRLGDSTLRVQRPHPGSRYSINGQVKIDMGTKIDLLTTRAGWQDFLDYAHAGDPDEPIQEARDRVRRLALETAAKMLGVD